MFKRRDRLPNARTVKRLYAKGRRSVRPTIVVYRLPNQAHRSRFSVVCGRKVHGNAVTRNRLKRRARATIQAIQLQLTVATDYLLVLRPPAAGHEAQLVTELTELMTEQSPR